MRALHQLTIHEAHRLLKEGQVSSMDLTRACLNQIAAVDRRVQACTTVAEDLALEQAKEADDAIASGDLEALTGVPLLVKDLICTKGLRTTCASRILEHFVPPFNADVIDKLDVFKPVILGKTNMDEFAMGSSNEHSAFFATRNPWDLERVPGGSSGGSAAAVASDEAIYALGSDTGGSIRLPAGLCGVVGLKPSYGRVSRYGLVAFASSLDQIGPLTKTVADSAVVLNAIAGPTPNDSTSVPQPVPDYTEALVPDIRGMRLGIPKEYFVEGMETGVREVCQQAIAKLEELGAEIHWEASLPSTRYALAVYYIVAPSEASANLARYDGVKYGLSVGNGASIIEAAEKTRQAGFGPEVKRRIMLGTYALSAGYYDAYYLKAQKVRTLIKSEFEQTFQHYDALVTPISPTVAFKFGDRLDDPLQMYLTDVCTLPINIAGVPAISVPAGFADGLPVGMQIIGKPFDEASLLRIAYTYEQATQWDTRRPPLERAR